MEDFEILDGKGSSVDPAAAEAAEAVEPTLNQIAGSFLYLALKDESQCAEIFEGLTDLQADLLYYDAQKVLDDLMAEQPVYKSVIPKYIIDSGLDEWDVRASEDGLTAFGFMDDENWVAIVSDEEAAACTEDQLIASVKAIAILSYLIEYEKHAGLSADKEEPVEDAAEPEAAAEETAE